MADKEEKGWFDQLLDLLGEKFSGFITSMKEMFHNVLSGLSGFWSRHFEKNTQQDQADAQRVLDESAKKGQADGRKLVADQLDQQSENAIDPAKLKEQATETYKTNLIKGALQETIERRKAGKLTEEQYNDAIELARQSSAKFNIQPDVFASMLSEELKAHGVNPSEWGAERVTRGVLASAEIHEGENDKTTGKSVVIQGDLSSPEAAFIRENQEEICNGFLAVREQRKAAFVLKDGKWQTATDETLKALPEGSTTLTFEGGKWVYKKGEQKVEIAPDAVTIATSRSEGLGGLLSFDGDPRDYITRENGPTVNEKGEIVFLESKQFEVKDLGQEKIKGKKTSGTQAPTYSAAILNDEIAAYVASNTFDKATVTVQDNDHKDAGIESLTIAIEDVTPAAPVSPPPATLKREEQKSAAVGS